MDVWMYGCMDVWMFGCMDVWVDGWMGGCVDGWMRGWVDVWMCGCTRGHNAGLSRIRVKRECGRDKARRQTYKTTHLKVWRWRRP